MSASVFEKIVSIVSKVVAILEYAMSVFFCENTEDASGSSK